MLREVLVMGRRPCTFKEADVTRAYKAAIKAGVMVEIKISLDPKGNDVDAG
jgi:hypothetical protein